MSRAPFVFQFRNLVPGTYRVTILDPSSGKTSHGRGPCDGDGGRCRHRVRRARCDDDSRARVLDANGTPIPEAQIVAFAEGGFGDS